MCASSRSRADACPGVLTTHDAADGALARVRLPGGALSGAQARALSACAGEYADGEIHLTSRGNVQLRGVRDATALARGLSAAGLLPSASHERVRNILASPGSGIAGGLVDVRPLAARLDRAVCARPELAELPGRFLFALDDGRGDVAGEDPDVCWQAVDDRDGAVLLGGVDTGLRVPFESVVDGLVEAAAAFGRSRGAAWRLREVDATPVADAVAPLATRREPDPAPLPRAEPPPPGPLGRHGAAVVAVPPFGRLPARTLRLLGEPHRGGADRDGLVVTPWRSLVVRGADRAELAALGLAVDPAAPEARVSACIGSPGCARSRADVRGAARDLLAVLPARDPAPDPARAHFSGCPRRCGAPRGEHLDVLAADDGYRIDGTPVAADAIADTLKGYL